MSRKYVVEAIDGHRTEFGDSLDNFCDGSIKERDSRILAENGFINIGWTRNPMDWIRELEETGRKPKDERVYVRRERKTVLS
jgi:hypothetical protein